MAIATTPLDPRVRIFVNNTWEDVHLRIREGSEIEIEMGNDDEALGDEINPGICKFTFDNLDGAFTPDNPMGPYYGSLEVNTPVCVLLDEVKDTCSRVLSNSWGTTDTGEIYSTLSLGAPINATDYSVDGSSGIHSVPTTVAYRATFFNLAASKAPIAYNGIWKIRVTLPFTDVTGGAIEVANLMCRIQDNATGYYMLRATVETDESIKIGIMRGDSTFISSVVTVPGMTNVANQGMWFMLGAFDDKFYATAWVGDSPDNEPKTWLVTSNSDTTYGYGRYGVRTGVAAGNTNAKPILAKYDNYTFYQCEFAGDIPEFPQEVSEDGKDLICPIVAGGVLRRYANPHKNAPYKTALRRRLEKTALVKPDKYWPLEEGELALQAVASVGGSQDLGSWSFINFGTDTSTEKHFGQGKIGFWMPNVLQGLYTDRFSLLSPGSPVVNGRVVVEWVRAGGSQTREQWSIVGYFAPGTIFAGSDADGYGVDINAFAKQVTISPGITAPNVVLDATTFSTNIFDGAAHHFTFQFLDNGIGGINWILNVDGAAVPGGSGTVAAHPMIASLVTTFFVVEDDGGFPAIPGKAVTNGHMAWWTTTDPNGDIGNNVTAMRGHAGEKADVRANRLCNEEGISNFIFTANGAQMGPQFPDTFFNQLEEIVRTDGGICRELMGSRAVHYDTLEVLRTRTSILTLNVGNAELFPDFKPVRDDQRIVNKIRAQKRGGQDYTYEKTTGRLSTADPKNGGAGVYEDKTDVNPYLDSQLIGIAQREVSEGTVDKARYPEISVNLMNPTIRNNLTLRRQVLDVYISARIKLTNMSKWFRFEDADLLVIGHKRTLSPFKHEVTFNTIPFQSLDIFHVETAGSLLGTNSSTTTADLASAATTFSVTTQGKALWTTAAGSMPITARIGGEDISVTNVTTPVPAFRSVGAASHGDNATLNPALPAGQVAGDILVCVTAIRNTSANADTPVGYLTHFTPGNFQVATKISTGGGEVAPSCTYSGGALGDTTSAFMFAIQNGANGHTDGNALTNGSAQNIAFPSCPLSKANGIAILFAWKQDDYTSVAAPADWTEIIEASTVTGNDQSLYAAYQVVAFNWEDATRSDTLVVTGGAAAISKAFILYFATPQNFTATRSQNGVVKSHLAGAPIKIAYPKVLG